MAGQSSSSIRFSCPSCGGRIKVPPGQAGHKCRCPRCDAEVVAPAAAATEQRPAVDPLGDDDFFSSLDQPQQQADRPAITLDDDFAKPLGPPPAPSLPEADLAEPPRRDAGAAQPDNAPISLDDAAIPPPVSIDDAPVEVSLDDDALNVGSDRPATAASPARKTASKKTKPSEEFGVECGLCGTRVYVTPDKIGREVKCPDCHSKIPIRAPRVRKKTAPPPPPVEADEEDMFRLSEPEERPKSDYLERAEETLAGAATAPAAGVGTQEKPAQSPTAQSGRPAGLDVIANQARSVLAKAKAEMEEADKSQAKLPDRPFVTGMISFLFDVNAITRWVVLTLFLQGGVSTLAAAFGGHYAGALLMMPVAVCSILFVWTAAVCYQAILQDTANGYDYVEQWPGVNFLEWMGEAFYVANALFASAVPGVLLGQLLVCAGAPQPTAFFFGLLSFSILFPIFLLSMVEEGSPLSIASGVVWHSLLTARFLWIKFYLISLGIMFAAIAGMALSVLALTIHPAVGFVLCGVAIALVIADTMIYFRLLGRLAWCLSELDRQRPKAD